MAYVKTVWETGDVITAEKLNNMEDGMEANEQAIEATDAIILEGDLTSTDATTWTFSLTDGDVEDITLSPNIYVKARVTISDIYVADILLKMSAFNNADPAYVFSAVINMTSAVYYANLSYVFSTESWGATLTVIS